MKVHLLQHRRSVALPAQLLLVRVQSLGGEPLPQLDAIAIGQSGQELVLTDLDRHSGSLVLAVSELTIIRLRPHPGSLTFGPGSTFSVSIGGDSPEADRVVLNAVDASGLRQRDLATLAPVQDEIVVTGIAETSEPDLPPLAARARTASRAQLDDVGVPEDQAELRVVVDVSASMRVHVRSGGLERALELLMGTGQCVSSSSRVATSVCGQTWTDLGDQDLTGFASSLAAAAAARPPSVGFRSSAVPSGGDSSLTFLLTDAVPADLVGAHSFGLHLIILSGHVPHPPRLPPGVGATVVPAGEGELEQAQLTAVVASLLSDYRRRFEKGHP